MHDILRERLSRQIEALPEQQLYQVLDYIEFLTSKYARESVRPPASAFQRFGERLEDKLRINRVGFDVIRGTLNVVGAADRVVSGLAEAGRSILDAGTTPSPSSQPSAPPPAQLARPETAQPEAPSRRPDIIIDD
jgi:hypothetical protein